MSVPLPVSMVPLIGRAASSGGFVAAVLIGLALYISLNNKATPAATSQRPTSR
jgi:hypothetical protein